jgi:helix-hairpin-helix protein
MADKAVNKIDINSAGVGTLTQLPGIAKNTAYKIINHRQRHGLFTAWEELAEVKDFPIEKLDAIKQRAELICEDEGCGPPRHLKAHLEKARRKPAAKTKALRSTRRSDRMHDASSHRPH